MAATADDKRDQLPGASLGVADAAAEMPHYSAVGHELGVRIDCLERSLLEEQALKDAQQKG